MLVVGLNEVMNEDLEMRDVEDNGEEEFIKQKIKVATGKDYNQLTNKSLAVFKNQNQDDDLIDTYFEEHNTYQYAKALMNKEFCAFFDEIDKEIMSLSSQASKKLQRKQEIENEKLSLQAQFEINEQKFFEIGEQFVAAKAKCDQLLDEEADEEEVEVKE